jgi:outer membrane protein
MKNLSPVLNIVLLIAVAFLYYKQFSQPSEEEVAPVKMSAEAKAANIVYVNSDSLIDNYIFYKQKKAELEAKEASVKSLLQRESEALKSEAATYQQMAETMSKIDREKTEQGLMAKQQALVEKKDELLGKLDEDHQRWNDELYKKVSAYVKEFNKEKNYQFILGYQRGGGILLANDSLDITRQVLDGLNKEYEGDKK